MRITVLGGTGFLGSRTVEALKRAPNVDVQVASRRGPLTVDATRPETFVALKGSDVVVDLIDATTTPPDALATWCVENGVTFIEATSDRPAIARLAALPLTGPGLLVLGGGIFTGVSNLLARATADAAGPAKELTLAISSSPYSGAGSGTINLMTSAMAKPAVRTQGGQRIEVPGLERGPHIPFPSRRRPTLHMSFAEQDMLPQSTKVPGVEVYFAPKPALLVAAFRMLPASLLRARWFAALMGLYFTLLRKVLLKNVSSSVELWARARGATEQTRAVTCADGMMAGAWALAASAVMLAEQKPARQGLCFIDDVLALDPVIARANALAGSTVLRAVA
ncbi:MAG: hypothetical protein JNK82_04720 [Myxococcaceae bacterium]|nr:hypothetical protein [Myxococcaceae bacterium]